MIAEHSTTSQTTLAASQGSIGFIGLSEVGSLAIVLQWLSVTFGSYKDVDCLFAQGLGFMPERFLAPWTIARI